MRTFWIVGWGLFFFFATGAVVAYFWPQITGQEVVIEAITAEQMAEALAEAQPKTYPGYEEAAVAKLAAMQADGAIINVHEHLQSELVEPVLSDAMSANGIGQTVLVGSSWFTITMDPAVGFTRYEWNNNQLLALAEAHPNRYWAWPTLNPASPNKLELLENYHARGASGLKLYAGHGYVIPGENDYMFHPVAMDDPEMFPIYAYCEAHFIPVCYHVNPGPTKPGFAQEFLEVLYNFPDLKINAPHFMLSSIRDERLREFLDVFPNLYSDISFGHDDFLIAGLKRISRSPQKFRDLFHTYPDRFMFGTDLVMTEVTWKDVEWFTNRTQAYFDMLTRETYTTPIIANTELNGLALPPEIVERVLRQNFLDFMAKKPEGTVIAREVEWRRFGVEKVDRRPGEAIPPPDDDA